MTAIRSRTRGSVRPPTSWSIAPATARFLAAYAAGLSGDLLTAVVIATRAPVIVCPAMHTEMWEHASVQENLATLRRRGVHVVDPESGRLAGGDIGSGRLASPERDRRAGAAAARAAGHDRAAGAGDGGRHREPIDTVRVIANRSSGKQGHALAFEAAARGAKVTVVTTVPAGCAHGSRARLGRDRGRDGGGSDGSRPRRPTSS